MNAKATAGAMPLDAITVTILSALASGGSTSQAADRSSVSATTVRRRLADVREAWGVGTNIQAVVLAVRAGYI